MMNKDQQIEALATTLHLNYDCSEEYSKDLAKFLYEEGYRLECSSTWVYDEYLDDMVCCACNGKALGSLTTFCPHCGSVMYARKN